MLAKFTQPRPWRIWMNVARSSGMLHSWNSALSVGEGLWETWF